MTEIPPDGLLCGVRVLVGDSVWEDAQVSTRDGWLTVEFEAEDLDNIAVRLEDLGALPTSALLEDMARNEQEWLDREYAEGRRVRRAPLEE